MSDADYVQSWSRKKQRGTCTLTAKYCRDLVTAELAKHGLESPSRVNSSLTRQQALQIFWAALHDKDDDFAVSVLSAKNILRECGRPRGKVGDVFVSVAEASP
jgi:hypothetical protein